MNRKHFTVGDAMAFPIVKMKNKKTQNLPLPLHDVDAHLTQQCLGPSPHASPQTAAPTVEALSHNVRRKFPIGYNGAPKCAAKSTPSRALISKPHHLSHP